MSTIKNEVAPVKKSVAKKSVAKKPVEKVTTAVAPVENSSLVNIDFQSFIDDVKVVAQDIYDDSVSSREKGYTDYYRNMTYRNQKEMEAVIGSLSDNSFLIQLKKDTAQFIENLENVFEGLAK